MNDSHAAATAAFSRLDENWISNFGSEFERRFFVGDDTRASRNNRQAGGGKLAASAIFFAHHANHFGGRSDESDVRSLANFRKVGVFRKEAIAGMDRIDVSDFSGADHVRNVQIAFRRARWADANRFVSKAHVEGIAVRLRINGDRTDP